MRTIRKTVYACGICNKIYESKKDCEMCEKSHEYKNFTLTREHIINVGSWEFYVQASMPHTKNPKPNTVYQYTDINEVEYWASICWECWCSKEDIPDMKQKLKETVAKWFAAQNEAIEEAMKYE